MRVSASLFLLPAGLLPVAQAWGGLGHETVAFVASNFVNPRTEAYFQMLLNDTSPAYLARVATWADSFRYTQAGRFSAPFHYIDSQDHPPTICGVTFDRDCGIQGCIVGAIANYTTRLLDMSLPQDERIIAAKFIIHFLGDSHQPLHNEHLDRGGNGINVTFDGKITNLHSVWDDSIPEKLIGGYSLDLALEWAYNLSASIKAGQYRLLAPSWLAGVDLADPVSSSLVWVTEANKYVCSTVMPDGSEALDEAELNGTYYERAVPVVELQIARAGYRLGAWLNLIVGPDITEL